VGTAPTGYSEDPGLDPKVWEGLHISAVFDRAEEFDVIHNSFDFLPLTYSGLVNTPVVTTIHGFSSERIVPVFEKYNTCGYYVAISDADRHEKLDYLDHRLGRPGRRLGKVHRPRLLPLWRCESCPITTHTHFADALSLRPLPRRLLRRGYAFPPSFNHLRIFAIRVLVMGATLRLEADAICGPPAASARTRARSRLSAAALGAVILWVTFFQRPSSEAIRSRTG